MTNIPLYQHAELKINGTTLADAYIIDVRVDKALSATAVCDIIIDAPRTGGDTTNSTDSVPGDAQVGSALELLANGTRVFKGEVTAITVEIDRNGERFVLRGADKSHRLWMTSARTTHLDGSYADAISSLSGAVGLSASTAGTALQQTHPWVLLTTSVGDWLQRIVRRTGTYWYVDDATLHVKPLTESSGSATVEVGQDIARISSRLTASDAASSVEVRSWDPAQKAAIVGTATSPTSSALQGTAGLDGEIAHARELVSSARTVTTVSAQSQDEANAVATSLLDRAAASQVQTRIEVEGTTATSLEPGATLTVQGGGAKLAGDYRVATITHVFNAGGWRSTITTGTSEPPTLAELAPSASLVDSSLPTAMIGVVTNLEDPDGKHRVKVKLPVLGDDVETGWARVLGLGAGATRGLMMYPQVDDEVLVLFERGDPRNAVVIGGLWNGSDAPPLGAAEVNESGAVHTWRLQTSTDQHITVMDKAGSSAPEDHYVEILFSSKAKLRVGNDKVELWADNGKTVEVKNDKGKLLIDAGGNITLEGESVTIKAASGDVKIEGVNVSAKGQSAFKAEGATFEVKGSGQGKVDGGGMLAVKGGMVQIN